MSNVGNDALGHYMVRNNTIASLEGRRHISANSIVLPAPHCVLICNIAMMLSLNACSRGVPIMHMSHMAMHNKLAADRPFSSSANPFARYGGHKRRFLFATTAVIAQLVTSISFTKPW